MLNYPAFLFTLLRRLTSFQICTVRFPIHHEAIQGFKYFFFRIIPNTLHRKVYQLKGKGREDGIEKRGVGHYLPAPSETIRSNLVEPPPKTSDINISNTAGLKNVRMVNVSTTAPENALPHANGCERKNSVIGGFSSFKSRNLTFLALTEKTEILPSFCSLCL